MYERAGRIRIQPPIALVVLPVCLLLSGVNVCSGQSWKEWIGWDALFAELGSALADGTGMPVSQCEATSGGNYRPNPAAPQFAGKQFTYPSGGSTGSSSHGTGVGTVYYGLPHISPGIIDIAIYEANDWINVATGLSSGRNPLAQPFVSQNHSWIGNGLDVPLATDVLMRIDHMAQVNETTIVAGVLNSSASTLPQLLAPAHNIISVGKTNGNHSNGPTTFYESGRVKPEIVAPSRLDSSPDDFTSFRVPQVAAVATILRQEAQQTNADNIESIKALILAGATKPEIASWSNSPSMPLDMTYGVGELNVYNSYKILLAGETNGRTTPPSTPAGPMGWDFGTSIPGNNLFYSIELTEPTDHLSIVLTWNIQISDTNPSSIFDPAYELPNLDMTITGPAGFSESSSSSNHNVEHVYARNLQPGKYTVTVVPDNATASDFALAWRAAAITDSDSDSAQIITGSNTTGGLNEIINSDDSRLIVFPESGRQTISAEFETTNSINMPNSIQFDIESGANTPNLQQTIELFNFEAEVFVEFNSETESVGDATSSGYVQGELFNFIEPDTGKIRARVTWEPNGPVLQYPWQVSIDRASWSISQ